MNAPPRDIRFLKAAYRYRFLQTSQLRDLVIPEDDDSATTRRRLRKMEFARFLRRRQAEVGNTANTSTAPVWSLTEKGAGYLAEVTGSGEYLSFREPHVAWTNLTHNVRCSQIAIYLDQAVAKQDQLQVTNLYFDTDVIQPEADRPQEKFKLYTDFSDGARRLVCVPDFAFEIQVQPSGKRRAYLCEMETGSDGSPNRIAARKAPGMAAMVQTGKWKRIFPQAQSFVALMFAPNPAWRDALRRAMKENKNAGDWWRFAAVSELNAGNFLSGNLFYTVNDGPRPFLGSGAAKAPGTMPSAGQGEGQAAGQVGSDAKG